MSLYDTPENSAGISRRNINSSTHNVATDRPSENLLGENTLLKIDRALKSIQAGDSDIHTSKSAPVSFEFKAGSAFFDLFTQGKFSADESIHYYNSLKLIFSDGASRTQFMSDFCHLSRHDVRTFGMVLRALGEQDAIPNRSSNFQTQLRNNLALKLFSLSLDYATGPWAENKNYLDTFFETFPRMFTREYYQKLNLYEFKKLKQVISPKLNNFFIFSDQCNLNDFYNDKSQYMLGKLYGVCLDDSSAIRLAEVIKLKINNLSQKKGLNNFIFSALAMYDSEIFASCITSLNLAPSELKNKTLFKSLKDNLKNDAIIFSTGLSALYFINFPQLLNDISNLSCWITTYAAYKLAFGIYSYNSVTDNDKWIKERKKSESEYDQNFITELCKTALEIPDAMVDLLIFMEKPPLDDARRIGLIKSFALIETDNFECAISKYLFLIYGRSYGKAQDYCDNLELEANGLLNVCFLISEHYVNAPLSIKSAVFQAAEFLPREIKQKITRHFENM